MPKLIIAFLQFSNASKNWFIGCIHTYIAASEEEEEEEEEEKKRRKRRRRKKEKEG